MYSVCSFKYIPANWYSAFFGFFLQLLEAVFTCARFSLTANVSHGTLYLVLGFVGIHFVVTLRCALTKFSYSSFGGPFSVFSCSVSNLFLNSNTYLYIYVFTNPSARAGYDIRSIFKQSLTSFNSEFSFSSIICLTKAEEPSLPYYLPIAGGRIIGFIPFPRVLVLCEMRSVLSRIWTCVAVSISYNNSHYTTGTSTNIYIYIYIYISMVKINYWVTDRETQKLPLS